MVNPTHPPQYEANVVIYTRQGCHLCDDAEALVRNFVSDVRLVDVDQDPQLRETFNTCVPVVEINGKVRFRGKVSPMLLKRVLEGETKAIPTDARA